MTLKDTVNFQLTQFGIVLTKCQMFFEKQIRAVILETKGIQLKV